MSLSTLLSTIYTVYLVCCFASGTTLFDPILNTEGATIPTQTVPHTILFAFSALGGWITLSVESPFSALMAALFYAVETAHCPDYAGFGVPLTLLGFIGYFCQKKIFKSD